MEELNKINGNTLILNWLDGRVSGVKSIKWKSYIGKLMSELFYESQLPNYGSFINKVKGSKHGSIGAALTNNRIFNNQFYQYAEDLSPRLIREIENHMVSKFGANWHQKWTEGIYEVFGTLPGKERFLNFQKLPKEFESAAGLEICTEQTFGVEIELTTTTTYKVQAFSNDPSTVWLKVAKQIINSLNLAVGSNRVDQVPSDYHQGPKASNYSLWKVEADSSVGWEIVSPILKGIEGALEVKKVLDQINIFLSEHDFLCINHRCGLHLNLETPISTTDEWHGFLSRYIRIEPGLFPLLAPARILKYKPESFAYSNGFSNGYCTPVSSDQSKIDEKLKLKIDSRKFEDDKYSSFQIKSIKSHGATLNLLEIRIHNGTSYYVAVLAWLALWMKILNHFEFPGNSRQPLYYDFNNSIDSDDEDIFEILQVEGISINKKLSEILKERRILMRSLWEIANPEKVKLWDDADFYIMS